jgi:hypothetical protein
MDAEVTAGRIKAVRAINVEQPIAREFRVAGADRRIPFKKHSSSQLESPLNSEAIASGIRSAT